MLGRSARNRLVSLGVAAMMAIAFVPLLAGAASASSAPASAGAPGSGAWAYGGVNSSSGNFSWGSTNGSWNVTFGIDVIFNVTNTSATTMEIKVTRTVVLTVDASIHNTNYSMTYHLKGSENDVAYANLTTTASTTLANGTSVAALGIVNASAHANASLQESLVMVEHTDSILAYYLNASGAANARTSFAPALGLIPLNLTGVTGWNSTSTETANSSWAVNWSWSARGFNRTASGSQTRSGGLNFTAVVALMGHVGGDDSDFSDHQARVAVDLALGGGFELRDGFVLIPVGFDFFSAGAHAFDAHALGNATITGEQLYLTHGSVTAQSVSAARATFGASSAYFAAQPLGGGTAAVANPSALGSPGTSVTAQPESPSQAQSQAQCLQYGCGSTSGLPVGLIALAAVALVAGAFAGVWIARRQRRGGTSPNPPIAGTSGPGATHSVVAPQPPSPPTGVPDTPVQGTGGASP